MSRQRAKILRVSALMCILSFAIAPTGCIESSSQLSIDDEIKSKPFQESRQLGWLSATAIPSTKVLKVNVDNQTPVQSTGGLIIQCAEPDGPLGEAKISSDDVIVRVDDSWLPIKPDATIDFIALIENSISSGNGTTQIGVLRDGKFSNIEFRSKMIPLEKGLPLASERMIQATSTALELLSGQQLGDGSFPTNKNSGNAKLLATSVCGLAFLSADPNVADSFNENVSNCLGFVSKYFQSDHQSPDPLTAAYVLHFLAETEIEFIEENWLDVIAELTDGLNQGQLKNGSWTIQDGDPVKQSEIVRKTEMPAVLGTFVTNQALIAIGSMERKGFDADRSVVKKALEFLNRQRKLRTPSSLDPRIKAILSAGTGAALVALNCDRDDSVLQGLLKNSIDRAGDLFTSEDLGLPGIVHLGILSHQMGNRSSLLYFDATKYWVASIIGAHGDVFDNLGATESSYDFESWVRPDIWRSANVILSQSVQSKTLERTLAMQLPKSMITIDHLGANATITKPSSPSKSKEAEELTRMILKQLKDRGVDVDESKLQPKTDKAGK